MSRNYRSNLLLRDSLFAEHEDRVILSVEPGYLTLGAESFIKMSTENGYPPVRADAGDRQRDALDLLALLVIRNPALYFYCHERITRIGLASPTWKDGALPLSYIRKSCSFAAKLSLPENNVSGGGTRVTCIRYTKAALRQLAESNRSSPSQRVKYLRCFRIGQVSKEKRSLLFLAGKKGVEPLKYPCIVASGKPENRVTTGFPPWTEELRHALSPESQDREQRRQD